MGTVSVRINRRRRHCTITLALLPVALVVLAMLSVALSPDAQAALEAREDALELETTQILRWPLRAGDSLVVRPCDDCEVRILQVTEETRYSIGFDGEHMPLRDLLRQDSLTNNRNNSLIIVFFRPNNGPVTRIILQTEL